MKILHVILGKADKNRANGVNQVIAGLVSHLVSNGVQVSVLGLAQSANKEGEVVKRAGFDVVVYTKNNKSFRDALSQAVADADIVHLHGTYSTFNIQVSRICDRLGTPYFVTLHGGLSPARNTWRNVVQKYLFHIFFQRRHLERAALIHALTEEESTDILSRLRPKAMVVIPNGVDLADFPEPVRRRQVNTCIRIGYIGRISREKNLDALCTAFSRINSSGELELLLAGPDSDYADRLRRRWSSSGVNMVGPKFGVEKLEFLNSIDMFVHPSKADVFSIAAMEALAYGIPLVLSRTSDASHFAATGAFVMCEPTAFGIERALRTALSKRAHWDEMVDRGRELIRRRLNWEVAARDLIAAYRLIYSDSR
jgi:glycosyltransferase involved in cell wall biosynthesis